MSVLEAMSHGLPIVATRVGGVPELVTDGAHGILLEPKDEPALTEAMRTIATDASLREKFGKAAKHRVETDFSFETMTQEYDDLYEKLLGASRSWRSAISFPRHRSRPAERSISRFLRRSQSSVRSR
ncbi:MAG: glycosyltransferase family 4 protein [Armatimonas sp.]